MCDGPLSRLVLQSRHIAPAEDAGASDTRSTLCAMGPVTLALIEATFGRKRPSKDRGSRGARYAFARVVARCPPVGLSGKDARVLQQDRACPTGTEHLVALTRRQVLHRFPHRDTRGAPGSGQ